MGTTLPFTVYSSVKEQVLLNVPITKPLLIVVLSGEKKLGEIQVDEHLVGKPLLVKHELTKSSELICRHGQFVFLSDSPAINMRNIPLDKEYYALIIEFDYQDFTGLQHRKLSKKHHYIADVESELEQCLLQFVESTQWAPQSLWSNRKRELLTLLSHLGHQDVLAMIGNHQVSHQLHDMFCQQQFAQLPLHDICSSLAMSESTLRRKLAAEGTSLQEIKDHARYGLALHLLQTSQDSIGIIAEQCGYQSPSRFSERFKQRFGLTPSELRKTKLAASGESVTV